MDPELPDTISIADRSLSERHRPFIVAEMSGNHNRSLERALEIVDSAAGSGADAIKLQTYTADTLTLEGAFRIDDPSSPWHGRELHELYREASTPWEWHEAIFRRAGERGLIVFSSPFDETSVDFLEELDAPAYKIASFENTHHPLLERVAQTGKPVILSTGVAAVEEIEEAVGVLRGAGCRKLVLLWCTSTYPASPDSIHLRTLPDLRERFGCPVGLSDHTLGIGVAVASVALGAVMVEKHFTLSRAEGGVDSTFSMEPAELRELADECERAWLSLGKVSYELSEAEERSRTFKRSIYACADVAKGAVFSRENLRVIRPSLGLAPRLLKEVLGKRATRDIPRGTPLGRDHVEW